MPTAFGCFPPLQPPRAPEEPGRPSPGWRLPLSGHVAIALGEALAGDSTTADWRDLLLWDPPSVLFALCHWRGAPPDTLEDVAAGFPGVLRRELRWSELEDAFREVPPRTRWPALVERSLATAVVSLHEASQLDLPGGPAYLLGLLVDAPEWFSACGPRVKVGDLEHSWLVPAWLAERIRACRSAGSVGLAAVVHQARRRVEAARRETPKYRTLNLPADVRELRGLWDSECEGASSSFLTSARQSAVRWLVQFREQQTRLTDLEENYQPQLQQEKLASMAALAYGAGHEINNPLANISSRAQTLLRDESHPARRRHLATINAQAFRAHEMIADMMLFAKPPPLEPEELLLTDWLPQVVGEMQQLANEQQTVLSLVLEDPAVVAGALRLRADGRQLAVAVRNLIRNSLEALGEGGHVWVSAEGSDDEVRMTIRDDGPGLTDEARRHMFDPYYSGREAGRGLGLGLSKVWALVQLHDGRIEVAAADPSTSGTSITLVLPR